MEDLEKLSTDLAAQAAGIQVVDQASASRATEIILAGKALIKKITGYFEPIKKKARDSWQGLVDLEKAELSKVEPIVNALNQRVSNWRAEEDGKRRAAETAAHRAEEEKQRLEKRSYGRSGRLRSRPKVSGSGLKKRPRSSGRRRPRRLTMPPP